MKNMKIRVLILVIFSLLIISPALAQELYQPSVEELIKETKLIQEAEKNSATSSLVLPKMTVEELRRIKAEKAVLVEIVKNKKAQNFKNVTVNNYRYSLIDFIEKMSNWTEQHPEVANQMRQSLKVQSDFEDKISPLLEKMKSKNKVRRFFFGTNYADAKEIEAQAKKAKRKLEEVKIYQETLKNQMDWEVIGQNIFNMQSALENVTAEVKNEKSRFSIFGWVKNLFV